MFDNYLHYLCENPNCKHGFQKGKFHKCHWNGKTSEYTLNIKKIMTLKETISWLSVKSVEEKIIFNELLLSNMTVMNRAIWDDPNTTDKTKVECLKWSNELAHRIWNILFELKLGEDDNSEIG